MVVASFFYAKDIVREMGHRIKTISTSNLVIKLPQLSISSVLSQIRCEVRK